MVQTIQPFGGLYIHIPFCRRKCPYCDFYSVAETLSMNRFLEALTNEISIRSTPVPVFDTLYFGGGTPSLVSPDDMIRIISKIRDCFNLSPDIEITLEVNPGTVTGKTLASYRQAGINRLNIGIQSLSDQSLEFLGRVHSAKQACTAYDDAGKAGFENIGVDMIYGLPDQTEKDWIKDLKKVSALKPDHISCYTLTYEPGTPFGKQVKSGVIRPLEEETVARMFLDTTDILEISGYLQYEISNFAKRPLTDTDDFRSRHNLKYWNFSPYLGFGPSAHSFINSKRSWNHRALDLYIQDLSSHRLPVQEVESIDHEKLFIESIYLGLRQTTGINIKDLDRRLGISFLKKFYPVINELEKDNMLEVDHKRCRLTRKGMLFLDSIAARFI